MNFTLGDKIEFFHKKLADKTKKCQETVSSITFIRCHSEIGLLRTSSTWDKFYHFWLHTVQPGWAPFFTTYPRSKTDWKFLKSSISAPPGLNRSAKHWKVFWISSSSLIRRNKTILSKQRLSNLSFHYPLKDNFQNNQLFLHLVAEIIISQAKVWIVLVTKLPIEIIYRNQSSLRYPGNPINKQSIANFASEMVSF